MKKVSKEPPASACFEALPSIDRIASWLIVTQNAAVRSEGS